MNGLRFDSVFWIGVSPLTTTGKITSEALNVISTLVSKADGCILGCTEFSAPHDFALRRSNQQICHAGQKLELPRAATRI